MSNLFKNLKPEANLHRNGFDLSQRHLYTSVAGELVPTLCLECVPGDKHVIDINSMVRTMPMNTAAYTRIKQYHHLFFVPYSILWSQWDSFITQRVNNYSSNSKSYLHVPIFNMFDVYRLATGVSEQTDLFGFRFEDRFKKLMDMLGYGNQYMSDAYVNAFRIAAYNKIWYDYYRNPYYDTEEVYSRLPYTAMFNFDDVDCRNEQGADITSHNPYGVADARQNGTYIAQMFMPKYRQYKKDMLTSLLPDTQFGSVSYTPVVGEFTFGARSNLSHPTSGNLVSYSDDVMENDGQSYDTVKVNSTSETRFAQQGLGINMLEFRKAEALQRWRETTLRAGQNALDQYEAHFGVRPRHTIDHCAQFIGGVDTNVMIDEVLQNSNDISNGASDVYGTGNIYGKGIGVNDKGHFEFNATEFGVLMCISSFVPTADYKSIGVDKHNRLFSPFDYFTPEYQNLGLEPVTKDNFEFMVDEDENNHIMGYAPRYWYYKTAIDKVHGGFLDEESDVGLSNWVTPRNTRDYQAGIIRRTLYINPKVLDPIFALEYTGIVDTDYFLCNDYFNVKSIRPMSVLGLPIW